MKRYTSRRTTDMTECDDGQWIRLEDVEKNDAETLSEFIENHRNFTFVTCPENCWCWDANAVLSKLDQMKAENERLKEEIEAIEKQLAELKAENEVSLKIRSLYYQETQKHLADIFYFETENKRLKEEIDQIIGAVGTNKLMDKEFEE